MDTTGISERRVSMDIFIAFIPLFVVAAIYWFGYKTFKKKHGEEAASPNGNTPYGIHGWLAFFIFASYYIAPLYGFGQLSSNLSKQETLYPLLLSVSGYQSYKTISCLVLLVLVVWQIVVAKNLRNNLVPKSLKQAKVLCFTAPIVIAVSDMIAAQITMSVSPNIEMIGSYLSGFVGSYLWGAYFIRSQRCKNTYLEISDLSV